MYICIYKGREGLNLQLPAPLAMPLVVIHPLFRYRKPPRVWHNKRFVNPVSVCAVFNGFYQKSTADGCERIGF